MKKIILTVAIVVCGLNQTTAQSPSMIEYMMESRYSARLEMMEEVKGDLLLLQEEIGTDLYSTNFGIIATNSYDRAHSVSQEWFRAYSRFKDVFRRRVGRGIVIDSESLSNEATSLLKRLGINWFWFYHRSSLMKE